MFESILSTLKGWWNKMIGRDEIKRLTGSDPAVSAAMSQALTRWAAMYENRAPWLKDGEIFSLGLPAAIASELARSVTIEMAVEVEGSARADYLNAELSRWLDDVRTYMEYGAALGGVIFKPYVSDDKLMIDTVRADAFYPLAFNGNGEITSVAFTDRRKVRDTFYTKLEIHAIENGVYTIRNQAYKSNYEGSIGSRVPLSVISDWETLQESAIVEGVDKLLMAYFRNPGANTIDPSSSIGISCYAKVENLIEQADKLYSGLLWEFESGQRALYADVVAFDIRSDGTPVLPNKRLYRALNNKGSSVEDNDLFHEWTPTLREQNFINGINTQLRKIEFNCGLSYGTLSDPETVARTATEITISKQRTYATIRDTQKALQYAIDDLLQAMDTFATMYKMAPKGAYSATYQFDDSVIVDRNAQMQQDLQLLTAGVISKEEFRMRNFGEKEEVAKAAVAALGVTGGLFPDEE